MEYGKLYGYGAGQLREAGIPEADLDARLLLEYVCQTDRSTLLAHGETEVGPERERRYTELIRRRKNHIPLQYITGIQEFMGLPFRVNENVLIPRQDTEILVEEVMRELHDGMAILDMCTGSGCILLSLLHYSNRCSGVGIDISGEALRTAAENAEGLSIEAEFIEGDLFENLKEGARFDIFVSNPPYIPSQDIPGLMEEVRCHEPLIALDGREDGLYFYRRIGREVKPYLYRGASLYFEIGCEQGAAVSRILKEEGYREIQVVKDFAGLDRVVKCIFLEEWDV